MILDANGNPATAKGFIKSAKRKWGVPYTPPANRDIHDLVGSADHRNLLSTSRSLYSNNGIIKGAINQKADYAIGRGFSPRFDGKNQAWGEQAKEFLKSFYRIGNVKGESSHFKKSLWLDSVAIDRDGDAYCLLTKTANGFPMWQNIPAHRIGDRGEPRVTKGRYRGLRIINGAIINRYGRVVAYRLLGDDPDGKRDQDISARSLIGAMDQEYVDSVRGIPVFSHALDDFKRMLQSSEWEQQAQMIMSAIALIEHNTDGEPRHDDLYQSNDLSQSNGLTMETVRGGGMTYFEAGSNSKIETLTNDRPSANWKAFHDRLTKSAIVGIGWSYGLLVQADGKSVADRAEIAKAVKAVQKRQDILTPFAHKKIVYALSVAIENGDLPPNEDFTKWSFTRPKSLTVDFGRDSKTKIAEYDKGITNLTQIVEEEGRTLTEHLTETYTEEALSIKIREEIEKKYDVKIDTRKTRLLTPNEKPDDND